MEAVEPTPLWPAIVGIAVGTTGLLISLALAGWNIWLYLRNPLIRISEYQIVGQESSHFLVLLRVSIVNHSNVGKVVYSLGFGQPQPSNILVHQVGGMPGEIRESMTFEIQNTSLHGELLSADVFRWPLDVAPNKSESRWFALDVDTHEGGQAVEEVSLWFYARNVQGNDIARTQAKIRLIEDA